MCQWIKDAINFKVNEAKNYIYKVEEGDGKHYWSSAQYEHDIEERARLAYEKSPHYQGWKQGKLF